MEPKQSSFIIVLLSSLLIISCLIAGFFAWRTQKLVKELRQLSENIDPKTIQTPQPMPIPTASPSPLKLDNLKSGDFITSPLKITGSIDKTWTFESNFSIEIQDSNRKPLKTSGVMVKFDNEQSDFGLFSTSIPFNTELKNGFVIFHADNPSGLPQNDKAIEIPVTFKQEEFACTMDAKICPDGSAVGRSGPKCEFAACPTTSPLP